MRFGLRYTGVKSYLRQKDKTSAEFPEVSKYNGAWLPTFQASYTAASRHQLTLTFNSSIEYPKFKDLNPFEWQINEFSFNRGNTNLNPQKYYATSIEYTYNSVLYFKGSVKRGIDIITGVTTIQGDKVYTQMENAQNSWFVGVEAGYYFRKLTWLNASIDGFYGRNKYTSTNPNLSSETRGNEWGFNAYLDFTFNKSRTWTGYISGDYTGKKHTTVSTLESQYDLGIGMSYLLLDRRLAISVSGLNLISSPYKGVSYSKGYTISFKNRYNYSTLYFSVSYKFSNGKDKSTSHPSRATQNIERRF